MYSDEIQQVKRILEEFFSTNCREQPDIQLEQSLELNEGVSIDHFIYVIPGISEEGKWTVASVFRSEEGVIVLPIDKTDSLIKALNSTIASYFFHRFNDWIKSSHPKEVGYLQ